MPLDLLAVGAHPDDIELLMGGTMALLAKKGRRLGILDLTRGENGTRGNPETRREESQKAKEVLGVQERITLDMGDGRLENSHENRVQLVNAIRLLRPKVVATHYDRNRHPDHARANELVRDCCFLANVGGYEAEGERHNVDEIVYFLGYHKVNAEPDWVVDVSEVYEQKVEGLKAYASQFYSAEAKGPKTYLSSPEFWEMIEMNAKRWGHLIHAKYGEAFMFESLAHLNHGFVRLLS